MRMERLRTRSEDILAYRAGSLRWMLVAAMVCLAGVVLFKIAATAQRGSSTAIALLALVGVGLMAIGVIALVRLLRRRGVTLDRSTGQATTWRSFLRRASNTRELGAFWTVLLSPGRVQERYRSRTVYLVGLHGEVGEPLLLDWDVDYQAARHFGEEVAAFLHFPFTDAAGTDTVIHPPGKVAVAPPSAQPPAARPAPCPATLQCGMQWYGTTLVVEEPRIGWRQRLGGPLVVSALVAAPLLAIGAYAHFFSETPRMFLDPLTAAAIVVGLLPLIVIAIVLSSLPQLGQRRSVAANADGLHFHSDGLFASKDRHLRRADIGELRIALGHLAAVTPRDYRVICGRLHQPLARAELEWLRDQLMRALNGLGEVDELNKNVFEKR